ncbi:hypothetical protein Q3C01_39365 [Bradyrhizobium sp. UFLA05-109]
MRRIAILIVSAAMNASTIPAVAAGCASNNNIGASCAGLATVQSQVDNSADKEKRCRAYATSFYESVMLRHAAANRVDGARVLAAIDSVIDAFNDLLATKCGG